MLDAKLSGSSTLSIAAGVKLSFSYTYVDRLTIG